MSKLTLNGNDLALAQMSIWGTIGWWKKRGRSKYVLAEIEKLRAVSAKLDRINNYAHPYKQTLDGSSPPEHGDEPVMVIDGSSVAKTRQAARNFNRTHPT